MGIRSTIFRAIVLCNILSHVYADVPMGEAIESDAVFPIMLRAEERNDIIVVHLLLSNTPLLKIRTGTQIFDFTSPMQFRIEEKCSRDNPILKVYIAPQYHNNSHYYPIWINKPIYIYMINCEKKTQSLGTVSNRIAAFNSSGLIDDLDVTRLSQLSESEYCITMTKDLPATYNRYPSGYIESCTVSKTTEPSYFQEAHDGCKSLMPTILGETLKFIARDGYISAKLTYCIRPTAVYQFSTMKLTCLFHPCYHDPCNILKCPRNNKSAEEEYEEAPENECKE